jgi:hypothetical protein
MVYALYSCVSTEIKSYSKVHTKFPPKSVSEESSSQSLAPPTRFDLQLQMAENRWGKKIRDAINSGKRNKTFGNNVQELIRQAAYGHHFKIGNVDINGRDIPGYARGVSNGTIGEAHGIKLPTPPPKSTKWNLQLQMAENRWGPLVRKAINNGKGISPFANSIEELIKQAAYGHQFKIGNVQIDGRKIPKLAEELLSGTLQQAHRVTSARLPANRQVISIKQSLPGETLEEAARLMDSPYKPYPEKFMRKHLKNHTKVRSDKVGPWKIMLVRNKQTGEWSVIFHGIRKLFDLPKLSNGFSLIHPTAKQAAAAYVKIPKKQLKKIGKIIDNWQHRVMNGEQISNFYGHSHGGYLATRVKSSWSVRRVTINGHKAKRGRLNLNLRATEDPLSKAPLGVKSRYKTVTPGGHGIKDFANQVKKKNLDWTDCTEAKPS